MDKVKKCVRCEKIIAYENTSDWYAYIRMKYCDECRKTVTNNQTAARMREMRKRKKQERAEEKTRLLLLQEENELLRKRVRQLRERVEQ